MAQENNTEIKDEGVTVTTTPKLTISASATAKLAATAENSTAFNIKTETSIVGVDSFSFGNVGVKTSKKLGATVTYQCGRNGSNFDTSHLNKSYAYTKDLTFSYKNGMAIRGESIEIANKTDIKLGSTAALALLAANSLVAPTISFGVTQAGKSKNWETSAKKKKKKADEELADKKTQVANLQNTIDNDNKRIAELEEKQSAGTITAEETSELTNLKKEVDDKKNKQASIQTEIDNTEKKNQEKADAKADIGGSPDETTSQNVGTISTLAGAGASGLTSIMTALSVADAFFGNGADTKKGIFVSSPESEIVMNAVSGANPTFNVEAYDNTFATKQASLSISDAAAGTKNAEFNSIKKFLAKAGEGTSMVCQKDSVTLTQGGSSAKVTSSAVELSAANNTMKIESNAITVTVGVSNVKVTDGKLELCGVIVK